MMYRSYLDPDLNETSIKKLLELLRKIWYVLCIASHENGIVVMFFKKPFFDRDTYCNV